MFLILAQLFTGPETNKKRETKNPLFIPQSDLHHCCNVRSSPISHRPDPQNTSSQYFGLPDIHHGLNVLPALPKLSAGRGLFSQTAREVWDWVSPESKQALLQWVSRLPRPNSILITWRLDDWPIPLIGSENRGGPYPKGAKHMRWRKRWRSLTLGQCLPRILKHRKISLWFFTVGGLL